MPGQSSINAAVSAVRLAARRAGFRHRGSPEGPSHQQIKPPGEPATVARLNLPTCLRERVMTPIIRDEKEKLECTPYAVPELCVVV